MTTLPPHAAQPPSHSKIDARTSKIPDFICEPLTPAPGSFDASGMARGEPGLPRRFTWRRQTHAVVQVHEQWITSGRSPCGETYLRRHWWKLTTDRGVTMTIYCERQKKPGGRWHVYTMA